MKEYDYLSRVIKELRKETARLKRSKIVLGMVMAREKGQDGPFWENLKEICQGKYLKQKHRTQRLLVVIKDEIRK